MNPVCEPFVVPVAPTLIVGWTGPARAVCGLSGDSIAIVDGFAQPDQVYAKYPIVLDTRRREVRDRLARVYPASRRIAEAEVVGAIPPEVAAALWWCAAHSFAANRPFEGALMPWRNVGPAGQKPLMTQWERASLLFWGAPAQVFTVPYRGEVAAQRRADEQLLTKRVALIDADKVRLPMPWGIVTIELEGDTLHGRNQCTKIP